MEIPMTKTTWLALAMGALSPALAAQDPDLFQYEILSGWRSTTTDTNPDIDVNTLFVEGRYFFDAVSVGAHPRTEAAFLERAMYVAADIDYTRFEIGGFDADGPTVGAEFRYAKPDEQIAATAGFEYGSLSGDGGVDVDQWLIHGDLGYWLEDDMIIGGRFSREETEAGGLLNITETVFGAFGKVVRDIGDNRAINVEAHAQFVHVDPGSTDDVNFEIGAEGDFYFTPEYSGGAILNLSLGGADLRAGVTVGVRGAAWVTPTIAVNAELTHFEASDSNGADEDMFSVFGTFRF